MQNSRSKKDYSEQLNGYKGDAPLAHSILNKGLFTKDTLMIAKDKVPAPRCHTCLPSSPYCTHTSTANVRIILHGVVVGETKGKDHLDRSYLCAVVHVRSRVALCRDLT
jgi:hypothetical protein